MLFRYQIFYNVQVIYWFLSSFFFVLLQRYGELLLQFSAVSYGDTLFGAFLLLPLQQKQDPQLRRMVWGENAVVLHILSTPISEVSKFPYSRLAFI